MLIRRHRSRHRVLIFTFLCIWMGCAAPVRVHRDLIGRRHRSVTVPVSGHINGSEVDRLEAEVAEQPTPQKMLQLAAIHAKMARQIAIHHRESAIEHYRDAAVYAAFALSDPSLEVPARALHSEGIAGCVRNSQPLLRTKSASGQWADRLREHGIHPTGSLLEFSPGRIDEILVASDLSVSGMNHHYKSDGLGCPLVAYRRIERKLDLQDEFYPDELNLPATAVMVPDGSPLGGEWRQHPVRLVLHDPIRQSTVAMAGRVWPLANDLTTPLAREQATKARDVAKLDKLGLLNPDRAAKAAGIFMLTPYQPGKIPIVLIHGLGAGPESWTQIVNDIQGDPQLRARYQVWMVRYATGNPMILSAHQVRKEVKRARTTFDPARTDPAFDRMVVIGHSLGGLITKTLVVEPGNTLWDARFTVPIWAINASPGLKSFITEVYATHPEPEIQRVVFIATPHQGSRVANLGIFQFLSDLLIRQSDQLEEARKELTARNGRAVFQKSSALGRVNAVDSLTFGNPVIDALSKLKVAPSVISHSIIGNVRSRAPLERGTDLVVEYKSAHHEGVVSEKIVRSTHFCLEKLETSAEINRILHEHLGSTALLR